MSLARFFERSHSGAFAIEGPLTVRKAMNPSRKSLPWRIYGYRAGVSATVLEPACDIDFKTQREAKAAAKSCHVQELRAGLGMRCAIPAYSDAFMRGARYGDIEQVYRNPIIGETIVAVRLDKLPGNLRRYRKVDCTIF